MVRAGRCISLASKLLKLTWCSIAAASSRAELGMKEGETAWLVDEADADPIVDFASCMQMQQTRIRAVVLPPDLTKLRSAADCNAVAKIIVRFELGTPPERVGRFTDEFLVDRFEWQIQQEPYSFIEANAEVHLAKIPIKELQAIGSFIRQRQFPRQCSERQILTVKDGMRFWGSMAGVHLDAFYKGIVNADNPPILQPYFDGTSPLCFAC
jgi:hypothetical protein